LLIQKKTISQETGERTSVGSTKAGVQHEGKSVSDRSRLSPYSFATNIMLKSEPIDVTTIKSKHVTEKFAHEDDNEYYGMAQM
jgi:hypothetical protein